MVAIVLPVVFPALASPITIEGGLSYPRGSFSEPTRQVNVQKGAESGFTFGVQFAKPLGFLDLVGGFSYVEFGEQYTGDPEAGEAQDYKHTFIPATIGLRKRFLGTLPVRPYLGGAAGLYGYLARGQLLIEEPAGSGEFSEENFTAVVRPGINFSFGVMFDVPFSFDLAAELKYHLMVFQGVGQDPVDREYPYEVDADSRTFTTLTFGLVF
jgi:hypothetical protein